MSENPQFKRTDKAIVQALISLLKRKPFEKITVQDILEETPVTRATFYAHYRDKFEIAEKMMEQFICARDTVRKSIRFSDSPSRDTLNKSFSLDREFTKALLQIHTEKVDFRRTVAAELEREYLEGSGSPTRDIEAKIYARAYVELYLSMVNLEQSELTAEKLGQILIPVAMRLLNLTGDQETLTFLTSRLQQKYPMIGK